MESAGIRLVFYIYYVQVFYLYYVQVGRPLLMQWSAMESAGGKIHQGATQVLQPATQEEDGDDIDCDDDAKDLDE